jgi:WD40 repeat protein
MGSLIGHTGWVSGLAFTASGELISSSADQTLRIWNPLTCSQTAVLRGHDNEVHCLAISADGRTMVSGDKSGNIKTWDSAPDVHAEPPRVLAGNSLSATFYRDGRQIILVHEGVVDLLDAGDLHEVERYPELGTENGILSLSPTQRLLAVADIKGQIRIDDLEQRHVVATVAAATALQGMTFSPDEKMLTTLDTDFKVCNYSTSDWKPISSWAVPDRNAIERTQLFPKENLLAVERFRAFELRNLHSGAVERRFALGKEPIDGVDFSPDGRWLAAGNQDGNVTIFDVHDWNQTQNLRGHLAGVHSVKFSPDGKRLLTGSNGLEAIKIWDTDNWQELMTLQGQGSKFRTLQISPDGRTLMATNSRRLLQAWHAPLWSEIEAAERRANSPPPAAIEIARERN